MRRSCFNLLRNACELPSPQRRLMKRYFPDEIEADFAVHLIGLTIGTFSAPALLVLAARSTKPVFYSVLAYSIGLLAMLSCSAVYHLRRSSDRRDLLRRLDHAAIFVMIAGTYTPFTVCILTVCSAVWTTGSMWLAALAGSRSNWPTHVDTSWVRPQFIWSWAGPLSCSCSPW